MTFRDYEAVAEPPLKLPIKGKTYSIPRVGIADGLRLEGVVSSESGETMSDDEFLRIVLGAAFDEMHKDNVPSDAVARAGMTALADHQQGRAIAEAIWETGALPNRLAAYLAAQQEAAQQDSKLSHSSESASVTPVASTKRTTSPKDTQPRKRAAKATAKSPGPS